MAKTFYWIKLYYDLLDDYKVGNLPDSLKWRFIQCLLVAGETQEGGFLPPVEEMAFRIRPITPEALNDDMSRLARPGLVELRLHPDGDERWLVTKFEERQGKISNAERQRAWRARQSKDTEEKQPALRDDNETVTSRYVDKIRKDKIADKSAAGAAFTAYGDNIGGLTPIISDDLGDLIDTHGAETVTEAINEAAKYNGRSLKYITAILDRWQKEGKNGNGNKSNIYPEVKRFMIGSISFNELSEAGQTFVRDNGRNDLKRIKPNSFQENQIKKAAENYVQ